MLACIKSFALTLTSSAFVDGGMIPTQYTCDGKNISPPLSWQGAPSNTQSYVLIMYDPDAVKGTWVHWVLFNIPSTTNSLPTDVQQLPKGTLVGDNSWDKEEYGGPCPPSGTHRYVFKLYALNKPLFLKEGVNVSAVQAAMQQHILAIGVLVGTYKRSE